LKDGADLKVKAFFGDSR